MIDWKGKGFSWFQNINCEYFPCHSNIAEEDFNCLFCYCPLYHMEDCGGQYQVLDNGIKDCSSCTISHNKNCYGYIIDKLST